jgi:nitronate monooxygenase
VRGQPRKFFTRRRAEHFVFRQSIDESRCRHLPVASGKARSASAGRGGIRLGTRAGIPLERKGKDLITPPLCCRQGVGAIIADNITDPSLSFQLVQVVDAVKVPVIAAGGIADARGVVAAFALGASGVQLGTAYLLCPEANVSPLYRRALEQLTDNGTALTNLFSGRLARGIVNRFVQEAGPMCDMAPAFPYAATLVAPLRSASERAGVDDYVQMWAGQAASLSRSMPADEFTRRLASDALRYWSGR